MICYIWQGEEILSQKSQGSDDDDEEEEQRSMQPQKQSEDEVLSIYKILFVFVTYGKIIHNFTNILLLV